MTSFWWTRNSTERSFSVQKKHVKFEYCESPLQVSPNTPCALRPSVRPFLSLSCTRTIMSQLLRFLTCRIANYSLPNTHKLADLLVPSGAEIQACVMSSSEGRQASMMSFSNPKPPAGLTRSLIGFFECRARRTT